MTTQRPWTVTAYHRAIRRASEAGEDGYLHPHPEALLMVKHGRSPNTGAAGGR